MPRQSTEVLIGFDGEWWHIAVSPDIGSGPLMPFCGLQVEIIDTAWGRPTCPICKNGGRATRRAIEPIDDYKVIGWDKLYRMKWR